MSAGDTAGLSLTTMRDVLRALGEPQSSLRAIHITGTNGKGSVAAMCTALLTAQGLSVGLYTSPDINGINERIRIGDEPISDDDLDDTLHQVHMAAEAAGVTPSRFEALTAAALSWFSDRACDMVVIEVGLLGRFDATNVVDAEVAVITSLGRDHTDGAHGWRARVLEEKAGIIRSGATVIVGDIEPSLRPLVDAETPDRVEWWGDDLHVENGRVAVGGRVCDIVTPWGRHDDVDVPRGGSFQDRNTAIAVAATEAVFDRALSGEVIAEGMEWLRRSTLLRGRLEVAAHQPLVLVDGAHNPDAAAALAAAVDDEFAVLGRRVLVVAMLAGKSPELFLEPFRHSFDAVIAAELPGPRGGQAQRIANAASSLGLAWSTANTVGAGVETALAQSTEDDMVVVTGSMRVVAPALAAVAAWERERPSDDGE